MSILVKSASGATVSLKTVVDGSDQKYSLAVDAFPGTSEADIAAIKTAVELLDNAISGSEMQVDIVASLPAGTNNIGDVDVSSISLPSSVVHGQASVATAGTEVAVSSSATLISGLTIKALADNTGKIYVGSNPVTSSTGFELSAGEQIFIEIDDPSKIYIDCSVNGEGVSYIGS